MTVVERAIDTHYSQPCDFPIVKRPLRIGLLGYRSHPYVGGQGIYLRYLSKALVDIGHRVHVLSGPPYPELDPRVTLIKIPSLDLYASDNHIKALRWRHLRSFTDTFEWWSMATGGFPEPYTFGRRLVRYIKQHRESYDILHDNQSLSYGLLQLQNRLPVLSTIHHPISRDLEMALDQVDDKGFRLLIKRWYSFVRMQRRVAKKLRHVTTVSEFSRRDIADQFQRPVSQTELMPNGIDTEIFRPLPHVERQAFRLLTTASSDQPLKGLPVLLDALAQLRKEYPQVHLHIIGQLKRNGSAEKKLKQLELQEHVSFSSNLSTEQLVACYAEAAVVVCPSLYEGFGLPAGEAMACEVPVVSSDGGALPEVVGDAGILVPAGDSAALVAGVKQCFDDNNMAVALGRKGRERILKEFNWQATALKFSQLYSRILHKASVERAYR